MLLLYLLDYDIHFHNHSRVISCVTVFKLMVFLIFSGPQGPKGDKGERVRYIFLLFINKGL